MHIWRCLQCSFLALLPAALAAQVPLQHNGPTALSSTLVDALSSDPDYSSLIYLLQRTRLIPTLNKLNGSTFFAPTNDAIKRRAGHNSFWNVASYDGVLESRDNVLEKLRQELFYHLLNYSLPLEHSVPSNGKPDVHKTLHFPRQPTEPPSREPPPSPPWMPIPGGTLGGEPQRLRLASRDDRTWVGADAFGEGGAQIVKERVDTANGVLLGVGDVLSVPPDLATVITQQSGLSYFQKIMTPQLAQVLNITASMTLFLPVDSAWDALNPVEKLYLESEFAADDLNKILRLHAVLQEGVKWSNSFSPGLNLTTIEGNTIDIVVSGDMTKVSSARLVEPDIYASNGVLHTVSDLLLPPGALQITPEKYLLTLNCTTFVSLLHSVDLTSLVNDTETKHTILAPRDDVLSVLGDDDLPDRGTEELKKVLSYHFLPGQWTKEKLRDGLLVETTLEEVGLAGSKQIVDVEVTYEEKKKEEKSIKFGGANVIGGPLEVNNTIIYFISRPLTPPVDHLQTALPKLDLSNFLAAIFSTRLANELKSQPRTTLLIPHNNAFFRLGGLVSDYLLRASSRMDLENVILHHTLNGVQYAQALVNGSAQTYPTLEGSDVHVERSSNGSVILSPSGGWAGMAAAVYPVNMLSQTGVVHELTDVMIPRSVDINIGKLARAGKATTMLSLVNRAGFDWILNGTAPPESSPWSDKGLSGTGWTLLCPTDDSFKLVNLTELYGNPQRMIDLVSQHLIYTAGTTFKATVYDVLSNNRPLALDDFATYHTLLSSNPSFDTNGDVVVREQSVPGGKGYVIGVRNSRGNDERQYSTRVLSWGRTTVSARTGGVILVDGYLTPYQPSRLYKYGPPVIVGALGIIVMTLFFWRVYKFWQRDTTEATYEPIGSASAEDD